MLIKKILKLDSSLLNKIVTEWIETNIEHSSEGVVVYNDDGTLPEDLVAIWYQKLYENGKEQETWWARNK